MAEGETSCGTRGRSRILFRRRRRVVNSVFSTGALFTLTAKFGDGSTTTVQLTLPPPPPGPGLMLSFDGKLKDRVGQGDTSLSADGSLDGTFTVALQAGSGSRTVTSLRLARGSSYSWDTTSPNASWILGAAASLDAVPLYNASNGAVFPLTNFLIFARALTRTAAISSPVRFPPVSTKAATPAFSRALISGFR